MANYPQGSEWRKWDQIALAITNAREDIVFTTATMEASWHSTGQQKIFNAVIQRFNRSKREHEENTEETSPQNTIVKSRYKHRGIVAQRPETLPGVIELLCLTGVELRMHPVMAMSRLRFLVQDNDRCVLGIADDIAEGSGGGHPATMPSVEPSKLSFSLDSTMLALALRWKFEDLWKGGMDPWNYLNDYISGVEPRDDFHTQLSILNWLRADGKSRRVIHQRLTERCPNYERLKAIPPSEL
jgi:hypothetical protein